jgi:hypothetical protein
VKPFTGRRAPAVSFLLAKPLLRESGVDALVKTSILNP